MLVVFYSLAVPLKVPAAHRLHIFLVVRLLFDGLCESSSGSSPQSLLVRSAQTFNTNCDCYTTQNHSFGHISDNQHFLCFSDRCLRTVDVWLVFFFNSIYFWYKIGPSHLAFGQSQQTQAFVFSTLSHLKAAVVMISQQIRPLLIKHSLPGGT